MEMSGVKKYQKIDVDWGKLLRPEPLPPGAKTVNSLAEEYGLPTSTIRNRLKSLVREGKVTEHKHVLSDRMTVTYYVLKDSEKL
jgi:DNA-binding IclR family transcriptional regulator